MGLTHPPVVGRQMYRHSLAAAAMILILGLGAGIAEAGAEAVTGPHTIITNRLPEMSSPVEALPGGGYVAFGEHYLAESEGSALRWKIEPILRKPHTGFPPGVQWLGGGTHRVFFYQSQLDGPKPWLGPGTENGLVSISPRLRFHFVRPLLQMGPAAFLNSRVGVFVIAGNFVLTFDSGRHLRPVARSRKVEVLSLRWLRGRQLVAVEYGWPRPSIVKYQLGKADNLRRIWSVVIPEIAKSGTSKKPLPIAYGEGDLRFTGTDAGTLWLASDKNLYAVDSRSGRVLGVIPGRRLTYPENAVRRLSLLPMLPGQVDLSSHGRRHVPSRGWPGRLVLQKIGDHIFAYDQSKTSNAPGQAGMSTVSIWTVNRTGANFDFSFVGFPPDQYLNTKQGILAIRFGGRFQRVSFRRKALVPVKLRVHVPGPGPWDPQLPVPRQLGARFVALFGKSSPLPPAVEFQIMKSAKNKFFYVRDRLQYMVDRAQEYLKKNGAKRSPPAKP